ncbi:MAG TPA: CHAT domain-containing protein [Kofleriaceae bacterium]|nr:CHAT domain-containing protein [Kofleriaceae bacterium]
MTDCGQTERTHLLADGELSPAEAEAAREHLATCAHCQAELADIMQLDAAVGDVAAKRGQVVSIAWYRKRNVQLVAAVVAMAAAVVIFLATRKHPPVDKPEQVAIVLAPKRMTEARVTWDAAAKYREYDVPRGDVKHEQVGLAALAELEKRGDNHGIGVLALLEGDRKRAATYLEKVGETPDVLVDRAAIALGDGQPAVALALVDRAMEKAPQHGAALWNRALALRDLGLVRSAAEAFRTVAKLGEPGWADEATQRAKAIDAEADVSVERFTRLVKAGADLARGELTVSLDDARAQPGLARGITYDAIRSAATPEALDKLAPLAKAIDEADRDTAMMDAIARAKTGLHPELSTAYAQIIRALAVEQQQLQNQADVPPVPRGATRAQLLANLRAARADDLLLGVLLKTSDDRVRVNASELAEFAKLAAASPDPWMQLLGLSQQAQAATGANDLMGAEAILVRGKERCKAPGAPAYRCIQLQGNLGELYLKWQRLPEARATLEAAWAAARASNEWWLGVGLLPQLARLAVLGDDATGSGLPLLRAYNGETVLRVPPSNALERCQSDEWGRTQRATVLINRLEFDAARRELAGPACAKPKTPGQAAQQLFVRAELATPADVAKLREDIAAVRADKRATATDQLILDHIEGRAIIESDPPAGEALLERAIAAANAQPATALEARKMAAYSYAVLAVAAAKRGDGAKALAMLAAEQGLTVPTTCVFGAVVEDRHQAFVARDAAGAVHVHHDETRTVPQIDPATLVPAEITAALATCKEVDVIARPPVHGMARILGDKIAWRYLAHRPSPIAPAAKRSLVVANVEPPAGLELPRLGTWQTGADETISGAAATPSRVLAAIASAGEVVINAHGLVDAAQPEASFLALSPESDGRYALTVADVRKAKFTASPLVILAACRASQAAPVWHATWSLPTAFVYAGARAVIASASPIPDADANAFFDDVRARIRGGAAAAIAVRDARVAWLAQHRGDWVRDVIVFE